MKSDSRQKGVALITVLMAMALILILSASMVQRQSLEVSKARHYLTQQQAYSMSVGAEELAGQLLIQDLSEDGKQKAWVDSQDERWAANSVSLPIDGQGMANLQINGLGGKINLNDLLDKEGKVDPITYIRLKRLFQILGITDVSVDALVDWVDEGSERISVHGAEDMDYVAEPYEYRTANQPFVAVSELRLMRGMTNKAYEAISDHVTALPATGIGVNINTASVPVIMSLHSKITESMAEAIVRHRKDQPFQDVRDFLALPEFSGLGLSDRGLTTRTYFFDIISEIHYNEHNITSVSRVYRRNDKTIWVVHRNAGLKNQITKPPFSIL